LQRGHDAMEGLGGDVLIMHHGHSDEVCARIGAVDPSRATSSLTRRPMKMSTILTMISETMAS